VKDAHVLLWAAAPILIGILYVASVGPVARLYQNQPPEAVVVMYTPLIWAYENTPARGPLEAYIELWLDN